MYYVYVLYSKTLQKKYIGVTQNIKKRLWKHNNDLTRFTSSGRPWKIIYIQIFLSKKDAWKEERFLKTGKGRERLQNILTDTYTKI